MHRIKKIAISVGRWAWFGFLVLLAFAYLAAGLSEPTAPLSVPPKNSESTATSFDSVIARVDQRWAASLQQAGFEPAPVADWLTVCRRLSLALVGTGMSLEEIRRLETYPEDQREQQHLQSLLNNSRFHHYWSERLARCYVGTSTGEFITYRRRRFRIWLAEMLAANRRYDQIVRDLITAEGLWTDRPEVNFLTATFDSNQGQADPVRLAARTSRAFLGLRIDCLQCHDDFLGNVSLGDVNSPREGRQTDFHQLAAFYSSAKTNGLVGIRDEEADYQYQYLDADAEVPVTPAVPFSPELLPEHGKPRERLAASVTHPDNRQTARAAVSHVWALMFGRPASEAVDNLPLDEASSPVIAALTDDFVAGGFDLRRLITVIAGSNWFRVDSRAEFEITPQHEDAGAVFPLVRLRPEQVAGSIIQSARIKTVDRDSSLILQLIRYGNENDFVNRYGDMGEDEFTNDSVTITQRLTMLNGSMLRESVEFNPILNASGHISMFAPDDKSAVETIYLCVLNRRPTTEELDHFIDRFASADNRQQAVVDLYWVLLNSTELAWNH